MKNNKGFLLLILLGIGMFAFSIHGLFFSGSSEPVSKENTKTTEKTAKNTSNTITSTNTDTENNANSKPTATPVLCYTKTIKKLDKGRFEQKIMFKESKITYLDSEKFEYFINDIDDSIYITQETALICSDEKLRTQAANKYLESDILLETCAASNGKLYAKVSGYQSDATYETDDGMIEKPFVITKCVVIGYKEEASGQVFVLPKDAYVKKSDDLISLYQAIDNAS